MVLVALPLADGTFEKRFAHFSKSDFKCCGIFRSFVGLAGKFLSKRNEQRGRLWILLRIRSQDEIIIKDKPTKPAAKYVLVGRPAARRGFLINDKPTKSAAKYVLVGRPAARRGFLIKDKPTKPAAKYVLVGRPAARRGFLINDKPTKSAA